MPEIDNKTQNQPILYERDSAIVELSRTIAEIKASSQSNIVNVKQVLQFKTAFIRVVNLTISDRKIYETRYKNTTKTIQSMVDTVRNTETNRDNINHHCDVAYEYIQILFSKGVVTI